MGIFFFFFMHGTDHFTCLNGWVSASDVLDKWGGKNSSPFRQSTNTVTGGKMKCKCISLAVVVLSFLQPITHFTPLLSHRYPFQNCLFRVTEMRI